MGLCKCPKKKVTNLFCFEHRVNVCEHCLVTNHPRCIVQSYLQWLQDSDYDPTCRLCGKNLNEEECGDCVRLTCYDVFHWSCLDSYARRLPANTAPAGYTCPVCSSCVFPAPNVASPVAESLRRILTQVNWARAGLGLPMIEEPATSSSSSSSAQTSAQHQQASGQEQTQLSAQTSANVHAGAPPPSYAHMAAAQAASHVTAQRDDATPYARVQEKPDFNPRKLFDSRDESLLNMSHDHDEDKYARRPALQWFSRWFSAQTGKHQRKDPNARIKRIFIIIIIAILALFTVVLIFSRLGRASADNDPFLDPLANPNIRVGDD